MGTRRHHEGARGATASSRWLFATLCFAVFLPAALQTLVVPMVNDIGRSLRTSEDVTSWVITANLLAAAVSTPLLGRLGDLRGRRPVLLGVLVTVLGGSLIAATAPSLPLLLVGRVLQGASYSIFPIAIALIREEIPAQRVTRAVAAVSGMLSVGAGVALVATSLLTHHGGDYRQSFWLAAGLTVMVLVLAWFTVPARHVQTTGRVDWLGATVLAVALVLLLTPLSQGNRWGWNSVEVIGCLTAAAVVFAVFVLLERATPHALVATRMLTQRPIVIAHVAGLILGMSNYIAFLAVPAFVETPRALAGYGFSATALSTSVVYLLPGALSGLVAVPLGGALIARRGPRATLVLSMLLAAVAFTALAFFRDASWQVILATPGAFTAVVLGYAAIFALLSEHVSPGKTGIANSVNSVARTVGGALASAALVTLLTRNHIPGLPGALPRSRQYTIIFLIGGGITLLSALLVTFGWPPHRHYLGRRSTWAPSGSGTTHLILGRCNEKKDLIPATDDSRQRARTGIGGSITGHHPRDHHSCIRNCPRRGGKNLRAARPNVTTAASVENTALENGMRDQELERGHG
ncbi:MFS transporter [Streptomyces chartreusis]